MKSSARTPLLILISCLWILASQLSHAILDTNNNGLSDLWEKVYNNNQLFPNTFTPQGDPDGDGWNNLLEATAGTDPNSGLPPNGFLQPKLVHTPTTYGPLDDDGNPTTTTPESFTVTWTPLIGKKYLLQYSPNLSTLSWLPIGTPFIGNGTEVNYYLFSDGSEKLFWRVSISDVDSDADGLNNYEENLAATDSNLPDSDGDGFNDLKELTIGTKPNNQDTDGDGIPDSIDQFPLNSAILFVDIDDDGITDYEDSDPSNPRGIPPAFASATVSGNPVSNILADQTLNFILTISNPDGPPANASNFTFFLNGIQTAASISQLSSNTPQTQRFLLTWLSKVTTGYPNQTLQNLTLRFRDAQNATSWLKLAKIDVAQWEGMIAGLAPSFATSDCQEYKVRSHHGGSYTTPVDLISNGDYGSNNIWYRGPREIDLRNPNGGSSGAVANIGITTRYPLFLFNGSAGVADQMDVSNPSGFTDKDTWYQNSYSKGIDIKMPTTTTVGAGSRSLVKFPANDPRDAFNMVPVQYTYKGPSSGDPPKPTTITFVESVVRYIDGTSGRKLKVVEFLAQGDRVRAATRDFDLRVPAKIIPYSAGTLEYPGIPLVKDPDAPIMAMASETWHKFVLKVGPDAAAVSSGIELAFRTGEYPDEGPPQPGLEMGARLNGIFAPLLLNAAGKIMIGPGSTNYESITSIEGLEIFFKRRANITKLQQLKIQLTPKSTNNGNEAVAIASATLLPVEFKNVRDVANTGDDLNITPKPTITDTSIDSVAWIDNHTSAADPSPRMPQLRLSIPGLPADLRIKAKLLIDYTRPFVGHQTQDLIRVPADGNLREVTGSNWDIYSDPDWTAAVTAGFFGGDATLTYQIAKPDGTVVVQDQTLLFRIAGQNPVDARCKTYIVSQSGAAWFAYAIAKHESSLYGGEATYYPFQPITPNNARYNQFRALGGGQSGARVVGREGIPLVERAEASGPGGIGMFQVTGSPTDQTAVIPRAQIWNWQANVTGGLAIMLSPIKSGLASRFYDDVKNDSARNLQKFNEDPPPSIIIGNTTFTSRDAIWLTSYNGWGGTVKSRYIFDPDLSAGLSIAPVARTKRWHFNPPMNPDEFYIRKVERLLEANP